MKRCSYHSLLEKCKSKPQWDITFTCQKDIIKKVYKQQMLEECVEKKSLLHCWWEYKLVQPQWKTGWSFLEKLKTVLPYDPVISLLGIYPEKIHTLILKDTCTPRFMAALYIRAKTWKQPKCPLTDEQIKKDVVKYRYNGILLSHKKNEIMLFVSTWVNLEIIISNEESYRKTNILWYHYMWNLKNNTNKSIYKTERDSQTF